MDQVKDILFLFDKHAHTEDKKPQENRVLSPEEFRKQIIDQYKKSIAQTEATLKKLDGAIKKSLDDAMVTAKKEVQQMEDGSGKTYTSYKKIIQRWPNQAGQ